MSKPRDIRDMDSFEAISCAIDNLEVCRKHVWVTKTVKINQGMCACCRKEEVVTICRYCGEDKDLLEDMKRSFERMKAASNTILPECRIVFSK
ncbi:MAG: hypothetical protein KAS32_26715 [Candidatus Peribacteraceae bacterium]|nr:hypothetical protein [Candidatus Peribacteraceae bacterium]